MPWGRLDDSLYDHPKLDLLGRDRLAGAGLWSLAISWCNRRLTDGLVPKDRVRLLGGTTHLAEKLVSAGLFDRHADGYAVHDFLEFNESREAILARRAADAARKKARRTPAGNGSASSPESAWDSGMESTPDSARTPPGTRARPRDRVRPDPTESDSRPDSQGRESEGGRAASATDRAGSFLEASGIR